LAGHAEFALAGTSAMVDRHIFTPDISSKPKEDAPVPTTGSASELEKEISFTGIMITPKGRQAILSGKKKNDKEMQKSVYQTGDQINGMTIKEIGSNYVMIAGSEQTVRLNLYRGGKNRPAPSLPEPVRPDAAPNAANPSTGLMPPMTANAQQPGSGPNNPGVSSTPPAKPQQNPANQQVPSPFGGANSGSPDTGNADSGNVAPENAGAAPNPFTEIMKNAVKQNPSKQGQLPFNLPPNQ